MTAKAAAKDERSNRQRLTVNKKSEENVDVLCKSCCELSSSYYTSSAALPARAFLFGAFENTLVVLWLLAAAVGESSFGLAEYGIKCHRLCNRFNVRAVPGVQIDSWLSGVPKEPAARPPARQKCDNMWERREAELLLGRQSHLTTTTTTTTTRGAIKVGSNTLRTRSQVRRNVQFVTVAAAICLVLWRSPIVLIGAQLAWSPIQVDSESK